MNEPVEDPLLLAETKGMRKAVMMRLMLSSKPSRSKKSYLIVTNKIFVACGEQDIIDEVMNNITGKQYRQFPFRNSIP
jgi:hypothetical protein